MTKNPPDTAVGIDGGPITHFLYEYEGERAIDPLMLILDGKELWDEQIYTNELDDLQHIWAYAEKLLSERSETPNYSYLEWLRHQVLVGGLFPPQWKGVDRYPYKGLLISALYLQEAQLLHAQGDHARLSQIIAIAYYNLGLGTGRSHPGTPRHNAKLMQANLSEPKRDIVLAALSRIEGNPAITSVAKAKKAVLDYISDSPFLLKELETDDRYSPQASKYSEENTAIDRLERTLNKWALPSGPYPEIYEAFAKFKISNSGKEVAVREFVSEEERYTHTRIISRLEEYELTFTARTRPVDGEAKS
jgi:hypothetical protein